MANHNPPTNGFKKNDPRINRRGRPKSFDALRELAQAIAHEEAIKAGTAKDGEKGDPVIINGHIATVGEMILRSWASSKNPQLQRAFMEYAFGKVPDQHELTGAGGGPVEHEVTVKDESIIRKLLPELASTGTAEPTSTAE